MQNKYPSKCCKCGNRVPKNGGTIKKAGRRRWNTTCHACNDMKGISAMDAMDLANGDEEQAAGIYASSKSAGREYQSWGAYFPGSGQYVYQNKAGRCIDAPCCGCCS